MKLTGWDMVWLAAAAAGLVWALSGVLRNDAREVYSGARAKVNEPGCYATSFRLIGDEEPAKAPWHSSHMLGSWGGRAYEFEGVVRTERREFALNVHAVEPIVALHAQGTGAYVLLATNGSPWLPGAFVWLGQRGAELGPVAESQVPRACRDLTFAHAGEQFDFARWRLERAFERGVAQGCATLVAMLKSNPRAASPFDARSYGSCMAWPENLFLDRRDAIQRACDTQELASALRMALDSAVDVEPCVAHDVAAALVAVDPAGGTAYVRAYEQRMRTMPEGRRRARSVRPVLGLPE